MSNERWIPQQKHSIPYILFSKHFTEINNIYWSYVPAASTIEKKSIEALGDTNADPRKYFLISDEDDRRLANTYAEWKNDFRSFGNYTRLNIIMLLSSCFETYLRTVVSLAIESKPAALLGCPDKIDGVFLLKTQSGYGNSQDKNYMFSNVIDDVCTGEWSKRAKCYEKYFGSFPSEIDVLKLDEIRIKRNSIGHFFARKKEEYEITDSPVVSPPIQISSKKIKEYFKLINETVISIDRHLHTEYIGSYDILKYFYLSMRKNNLTDMSPREQATELRKQIGKLGMQSVGKEYYINLLEYFNLQSEECVFKYSRNSCVQVIKQRLGQITIKESGNSCEFSNYHFRLFCKVYNINGNLLFAEKHEYSSGTTYFYSEKAIDFIVNAVLNSPETIIDDLKNKV